MVWLVDVMRLVKEVMKVVIVMSAMRLWSACLRSDKVEMNVVRIARSLSKALQWSCASPGRDIISENPPYCSGLFAAQWLPIVY